MTAAHEHPAADASVRPARSGDAAAIADVQVRAWRASYATALPAGALDEAAAARDRYADRWRQSIDRPPSSHHRVLVALAGTAVAGFAAYAPCGDADRWARTDAELLTLAVDPERRNEGHGSRLLNAGVDVLREDGYLTLSTWLVAGDDALRRFLETAGWAADGASRELEAGDGTRVRQLRLATRIG